MSEVQRLREKADRCHRLARTIFDEQMVKALREYAAEAEEEAAVLEAGSRLTTPLIFLFGRSCADSQGFPTRSGDFLDECVSWGWKRRSCVMADG
jgi:hypothetical protein